VLFGSRDETEMDDQGRIQRGNEVLGAIPRHDKYWMRYPASESGVHDTDEGCTE